MRILYLVHGHEDFSVGGAEKAAFSLFREAEKDQGIQAWILAAIHTDRGVLSHGELRCKDDSENEYMIGTSCEWFQFRNAEINIMRQSLRRLLEHIDPEIIHIQHYIHFGIDIIPLLQRMCPKAKIVLTLHEYLALCMNNGQMVTTAGQRLCKKASPLLCSVCFPNHKSTEFFLRHQFIKTIIESCDALVSPSKFLVEMYRESGISHDSFSVIENGLSLTNNTSCYVDKGSERANQINRFAFFGQITQFKGCLLLLEAVRLLRREGIDNFNVNIFGANLHGQPKEFQKKFNTALAKVGELVSLRNSYEHAELPNLMEETDWVVVPSTWWENSPLVIQEAFYYGKPVITSNIGGMLEKVVGKGGLTFQVNSAVSLANTIRHAIGNLSLYESLTTQIPRTQTTHDCLAHYRRVYETALSKFPVSHGEIGSI